MSILKMQRKLEHLSLSIGCRYLFRRPFPIRSPIPFVSFTFDDFPRSAFVNGGAILEHYGIRATYYASLSLMGRSERTGPMFLPEDLKLLLGRGHELGCHTFGHCHSGETKPNAFENSLFENRRVLGEVCPGAALRTFSYPISLPRAWTKHKVSRHFECCRGGGQTFNTGTADLNCLCSYFIEKSRGDFDAIRSLIEQNQRARGWLILATHDVDPAPSPFGCTPDLFDRIVKCSLNSGAVILPVAQALESLRVSAPAVARK